MQHSGLRSIQIPLEAEVARLVVDWWIPSSMQLAHNGHRRERGG